MTFRIGVIGAGTHGTRYLRHAARDVPGLVPVALCRRDPAAGEELAAEWNCRAYTDAAALIADPEVDGVVVATPPRAHYPCAAAAREAGKPVLLEKPLTGTLDEARRLAALDAAAPPPPLMLAQTLRWNPVILAARRLWPRLGRVHLIRLSQRLSPTALAWQHSRAESVGGSVLLTGVHVIDLARFLTGSEFAAVDSRQRQILNPATEDLFLARGTLADGTWVALEVSKYTRSRACLLEAVGEEGQLLADYQDGGITLIRGGERETVPCDAAVPTLPPVLAAWLESVRTGSPPPVTVADGVRTLEVVEACYRSHAEGREVAVGEPAA